MKIRRKLSDPNYLWKSLVSQEGPDFQCDEFTTLIFNTENWEAYESNRNFLQGPLIHINSEDAGIFPAEFDEEGVNVHFDENKKRRYRKALHYDINEAQYEDIAPSKRGRKRKQRKHTTLDWLDDSSEDEEPKRKKRIEIYVARNSSEEKKVVRKKRKKFRKVSAEDLERIKKHLKEVKFEKFGTERRRHQYRGDYKVTASLVQRYLNRHGKNAKQGKMLKVRRFNMLDMWETYAPETFPVLVENIHDG